MRGLIAAVVLLSASGSSALEPLKPAKVMPEFHGGSSDGRWGMSGDKNAVGFWDLRLGKQIAAVELPMEPNRPDALEGQETKPGLFNLSSDGRFALVSVYTHYWNSRGREWLAKSASKLYLLSVNDGNILATILDLRKSPCDRNYGITGICPRVDGAIFSPDGTKIIVQATLEVGWTKGPASKPSSYEGKITSWSDGTHKKRVELLVTDLKGNVLDRYRYSSVYDSNQDNPEWVSTPVAPSYGFLPDGRAALLIADGAGCRIKDFSGAQIAFLEDCSPARMPQLSRGKAWSSTGGVTVWNPLTGAVLLQAPAAPRPAFSLAQDLTSWVETTYAANASTASVRIVDAATGKTILERVLSVAPGLYLDDIKYVQGEDRLLLFSLDKEYKQTYAIYAPGAPPAAPVAAPVAAAEPAPGVDIDVPPQTKAKLDPDAFAVVIGVEKYRQEGIPVVDYAERDAAAMRSYLTGAMGYDPKNVAFLTDGRATKTDLEKYLGKWLSNRVTAKSRVFVYYAGHGSPNPTTGDAYLMPYEADPAYLEETAVPLSRVYAWLAKLPTKSVSVVLDACFSGQGGRSLVAKGTRPLVATKETKAAGNSVVLAAAGGGQISASDPTRRHGLLTAALLEALHGAADADGDGVVTAEEAFEYARPAVERAARLQNVEQTPTFSGKDGSTRAWMRLK